MSRFVVLAGAAAAVAVAVGAVAVAMPKPTGVVGGPGAAVSTASPSPSPIPSPSPTPVPSPSATPPALGPLPSPLDTSAWKTYTSDRYGFTIAYPPDWSSQPATENWGPSNSDEWPSPGREEFESPGGSIGIGAFSVPVTPGTSIDSWLVANCPLFTTPCDGIRDRATQVTMDGHPALLVTFVDDVEVFSLVGDRMWVVASGRPANLFDSLASDRVLPLDDAHPAGWPRPFGIPVRFACPQLNLSPGTPPVLAPRGRRLPWRGRRSAAR